MLQSIQISANVCDFDKPTITRRKIIVLSPNLQKYLHFFWDAHIRHIPPSGVFPHLRHISWSVYVPQFLNRMKPVELEGQNQDKTNLLWPFCFIFAQKWKKLSFSWHLYCHISWIWPHLVNFAIMPWMFNPKNVANLLLVWDRAVF